MYKKIAQRRSLRSKFWENVNLTGKAVEELNPEVREVMEKMRATDEEIRQVAENVKDIVRSARRNVRTRDYLTAAYDLSEFHLRCKYVAHLLSNFAKTVDVKHYQYLLEDFQDPYKSHLFKYNPSEEIKSACENFDSLIKESGIIDTVKDWATRGHDVVVDTGSNIISDKGRARRMMEKRLSTESLKKLRGQTTNLLSKAETLLRQLLNTFSLLESGVSRRNIPLYVSNATKFSNVYFKAFHDLFVKYYEDVVNPIKIEQEKLLTNKEQQKLQQEEKAVQEEIQLKEKEHENYSQKILDDAQKLEKDVEKHKGYIGKTTPKYTEPSFEEWKEKKIKEQTPQETLEKLKKQRGPENYSMSQELLDQLSDTYDNNSNIKPNTKSPKPLKEKEENTNYSLSKDLLDQFSDEELENEQKAANKQFIDKIIVYATNDQSQELFEEIIDYSEKIEDINPVQSQELLLIAENIIRDKQAGIFDIFKKKEPETKIEPKKEEIIPKQKPQELVEQDQELYKVKKIDLANGKIDQAFSDVPALKSISVNKIRITPDTARLIISTISRRLAKLTDTDDMSPFANAMENKLIPSLKQSVYDGWLIGASAVSDGFNPYDKYLEIYIRLNLQGVHPDLDGIAKMRVGARLSADHGILTVRAVQKNFDVEVSKREVDKMKENFDEDDEPFSDRDIGDNIDNEDYYLP